MEIVPVQYGESFLSEDMIFFNGSKNRFHKIVFKVYLIKKSKKLILVDAGCITMPGFEMKNFIGVVKALENINIYPEEITDVVITHSHHDHIECVKFFENATIHIQKEEYEIGKQYIPCDLKVNIFDKELTFCENIRVLKIAGHSKGSCIVEIESNSITYVIAGDECYLRECITNRIPTGCSIDPEASLGFVNKYSNKKYHVLLCHDN